jgi:GAF domain-containing protein
VPSQIWYGAEASRYDALREATALTYLSSGEGLPGRVWQSKAPVWVADIRDEPGFQRIVSACASFVSAVSFPIVSQGVVVAIVEFFTETRAEPDPDLLLTLHAIGDQIGRVYERQHAEQALREQAEALETINRINLSLAGELDLERLAQAVTDAATQVSGAAFGSFFHNVIDASGETYMLYSLSGVPRSAFENFPMPRNTAIFGPTFRGEGPVLLDDVTKDSRYGRNAPYHGMPDLPLRRSHRRIVFRTSGTRPVHLSSS